MRLWIKAWGSVLRDPALFARPSAGFSYLRIVYESSCWDGTMPQAMLQALAISEADTAFLVERGYLTRDRKSATISVDKFKRDQTLEENARGLSDKGKKAAEARWDAPSNASSNATLDARCETLEAKTQEPELSSAKPRTCPAVEALNQTARASRGRLGEVERVTPGQSIHFNRSLKAIYGEDDWQLLGEWLAAGGEGFRKTLSSGVILSNATDWIEQAKAWEKAGEPELGDSVNGRKRMSPHERDEEYDHYHTGALEKYRAMDRERAAEEAAKSAHHLNGNGATNGKA